MAVNFPLIVFVVLVVGYVYRILRDKRFNKVLAEFPQPGKPSLLWGHGNLLRGRIKQFPAGIHIDAVLRSLLSELPGDPSLFLLDLRPFFDPMLITTKWEVAEQISRPSKVFPWSVPKAPLNGDFRSLLGAKSVLAQNGEPWKAIRKRFNPGFAPQHLLTLLPCVVDKTTLFVDRLDQYAKSGQELKLTQALIDLTFDIIGAVVMGVDFDAQLDRQQSSTKVGQFITLFNALIKTYGCHDIESPELFRFPTYFWKRYRLAKKVDSVLGSIIRDIFNEQREQNTLSNGNSDEKAPRSILQLSLQGYDTLTDDLLSETVDQIKSFVFAGHDTTSLVLSWAFYYLSLHPQCHKSLCEELDSLFGPDPDPAVVTGKLLSSSGRDYLKRMPYTTAVIKETMRVRPPAGSARRSPPGSGFTVRTPDGKELCIDGMLVYFCASIMHRDRKVFGETADDFIPERWLNEKSENGSATTRSAADGEYPTGSYRPFERGPRGCIGQDLAMLEARIILAAAARRYEFVKVGLGEVEKDEKMQPVLDESGRKFKVGKEVYCTSQVTPKPADMMLMRIKIRK